MKPKTLVITVVLLFYALTAIAPAAPPGFSIDARAAVLIDPISGKVLYGQDEHKRLPPASVTKVMTMLLIMEALDSGRVKWSDMIPTSRTAEGMGGSQIYLKEGEEMTLREMFKAIAVVSANDASTAVAEYLYGSDQDFIVAMNERARKLGLKDTHFANETGLPDPDHYSSAYDLAMMSRELLKHPQVPQFTSIWLDSLRGGKFMLRNTNELIKVYKGADGLKTGHTDEAGFCLSGTAKRNGFRLLSVVLGVKSDADRVFQTRRLLDYGFRTYQWKLLQKTGHLKETLYLSAASPSRVPVRIKEDFGILVERDRHPKVETRLVPLSPVKLPLGPGRPIGRLEAVGNGKVLASTPLYTVSNVRPVNFLVRGWRSFWDFVGRLFSGRLFRK